ncbi:MAG: S41 family peptidase [Armatimonadetes bacterium]|nr:S41 family peptidase [Armatimonadota bacterium]
MTLRPRTVPLTVALSLGLAAPAILGFSVSSSTLANPPSQSRATLTAPRRAVALSRPLPPARRMWASIALLPERTAPPVPIALKGVDTSTTAGEVDDALRIIRSRYFGAVPDRAALKHAAVKGMVDSLGDRYTRYLDPVQFRRMQEENSGQFGGIGVTLVQNAKNQAEVSQVDADGPAKGAGIRVGDLLVEVAGHPIRPGVRAAERAQSYLHGDPRTWVNVAVQRKGAKAPLRFSLLRKLIYTPTVTARLMERGVGYIKLDTFGDRSDEEVGLALRKLKSRGMRSLVLDLRGNPGGFFNTAVDIASRFIDRGPVVFTRDRDNHRVPVPNIPSKRLTPKIPVAVLVDRWSASAAEIVAAAIQDTGSGVVIGQKTYGKALVQTITPNPDGSAVLITTHHYYTPRGTDISHKGVKPNILVESTPRLPTADLPLQRALAWLSDPAQTRITTRN